MWDRLAPILNQNFLCQRHEDRLSPDIPDVSFVRRSDGSAGWIELKTIDKWRRDLTKLHHLSAGQVNWLYARARLGADVWLLLWVRESDEWLWIPGYYVSHSMRDEGLVKTDWLNVAVPFDCVPQQVVGSHAPHPLVWRGIDKTLGDPRCKSGV